jgi:uncharacterized membrane protein (UPF0127 family)
VLLRQRAFDALTPSFGRETRPRNRRIVSSDVRILCAVTAGPLCAALAIACGSSADPVSIPTAPAATATSAPGMIDLQYDGGVLRVELAVTAAERSVGLSNRDSLAADAGMLFIFENPRMPRFWMKDTRIPLDMIWIGADKRIVEIDANVQPEPGVPDGQLRRYGPDIAVSYGLEVNAGTAARLDLRAGSQLQFDAPAP